jgi:hypothetical protein
VFKSTAFVALAFWCAGCSGDGKTVFSTREAAAAECANGGSVFLVDDQAQATVCNGEPGDRGANGEDGGPGPSGPTGSSGPSGSEGASAGVTANVRCSGSYESGDDIVYVNIEYVELSDGNEDGICYVSRRNYGVVDIKQYTGGRCLLIDWTTLDLDGGTDAGGKPLTMDLILDIESGTVTAGFGGPVMSPLTCNRFNPETGDYL